MPDRPKTSKPRSRRFQQAGASARKTLGKIAGKNGFAEVDVLLRWPDIVGAGLSGLCRPLKVSYSAARSLGASLIVHADSGRALEVEHRAPQIIERINQFYGYRAISRLKITQSGGAAGLAEEQAAFSGPDLTPTQAETARAAGMAEGIASPGLRAALTTMGANVLARSRAGRSAASTRKDR